MTAKNIVMAAAGVSTGGYQISRSLRFNAPDSAYLNRTFSTPTNAKIMTFSAWIKRCRTSDYDGIFSASNGVDQIRFQNNDTLHIELNSAAADVTTTQVFRDPSAWYHIVVAFDTTQATASNRVKIYVNGVQVTSLSVATYPTQNYDLYLNNAVDQRIGIASNTLLPMSGYMTEIYRIDGQALTPSSFGQTDAQTGVWTPIAYSGSYGTNGFYLNFSDNSNTTAATLGKDYSGNGNNWTPNNFSVTAGVGNDSVVDSPTQYGFDTGVGGTVRGNYATLNRLFVPTTASVTNPTLANGNLSFVGNLSTDTSGRSTIGVTSGKWYCEVTVSYVSALQDGLGIAYTQSDSSRVFGVLYRASGDKCVNNTVTSYGTNYVAGSVIGIALDADANTVTFYNTNVSQGSISFTPTTAIYFSTYGTNASPAFAGDINFGQRPFVYTAPSGFKALCTQNLPTPTIGATSTTQAGKYFNPVIYTGNSTTRSITDVGFQPDFVWGKSRTNPGSGYYHFLMDSVRGKLSGYYKNLYSNSTDAEDTYPGATYGGITSFDTNGFTLAPVSGTNFLNENTYNYVAWNWKANGSGSTNTSGSITSTVSANTTSGFSVVTYTGNGTQPSTVGHGLGVAPSFIIVKTRNSASYDWNCYHVSLGNTQYIALNTTAAASSAVSLWNNTTPTSTVFTINHVAVNTSSNTYVAYCFAEVAGYSKFGSYTGNGSSDGVFVYCGFRPAFFLAKNITDGGNWNLYDNTRGPYNLDTPFLIPNSSAAEYTGGIDLVSNGVKIRTDDSPAGSNINQSGKTYIFAAFASTPFKYALAR